jgi:hypothetical protein
MLDIHVCIKVLPSSKIYSLLYVPVGVSGVDRRQPNLNTPFIKKGFDRAMVMCCHSVLNREVGHL